MMNTTSNEFAWSPGRSAVYNHCPLKYYFSYVLGSQGWRRDASPDEKTAYKIGHLTTLPMEVGSIVHQSIKNILTKKFYGAAVNKHTEISQACESLTKWMDLSKNLSWQELGWGRRQLIPHFEGKNLSAADIEEGLLSIRSCVNGFFASRLGHLLMKDPSLLIPQMIDPDGFQKVSVDEVLLLTRTDAVIRQEGLLIVDWKTGRQHDSHAEAAVLLDLYVRKLLEVPKDWRVRTIFVYLQDVHEKILEITEDQKSDLLLQAHSELQGMREDHHRVEKGEHPQRVFPPRPRLGICKHCNFRLFCPHAKTET